jgi:RHS repeat-associated protein
MAGLNPFQFSTHYTDQETGLVYAKRRYYNPSTGRFVSRDPKGEGAGMNLLAYCRNNPISKYDPFGLWSKTVTNDVWTGSISDKIGVNNDCGDITISPVYIDASYTESLDNTTLDTIYNSIPGGPTNWDRTRTSAAIYAGAGFVATYNKSDNCKCCDHFWWQQQIVGGSWFGLGNSNDGGPVGGNTFVDFPGMPVSGVFSINSTVNYILNLYCGGSGGSKRLLKTINWSRHIVADTELTPNVTVTLDINW